MQRHRIKLSDEIDNEMKERIKCFIKTFMLKKHYFTFVSFCCDFNKYLEEKGKRNNFTDRVLSNKLNRGDIRFYEVIQMLDFLNYDICFKEKEMHTFIVIIFLGLYQFFDGMLSIIKVF